MPTPTVDFSFWFPPPPGDTNLTHQKVYVTAVILSTFVSAQEGMQTPNSNVVGDPDYRLQMIHRCGIPAVSSEREMSHYPY